MDLVFKKEDIENDKYKEILYEHHPVIKAMKNGKLIIFVGAGMSVHLDSPDWRGFANKYLDLIYKYRDTTKMNFKTKESLKMEETKKVLSLCKFITEKEMTESQVKDAYEEWFRVELEKVEKGRLYEKLYSLNSIYITTNYDNALDLLVKKNFNNISVQVNDSEPSLNLGIDFNNKIIYKIEDATPDCLRIGNVIHIHGSIEEIESMVISNEDYIQQYSSTHRNKSRNKKCEDFLKHVFNNDYTIVFIGYGLAELEILQHLFNCNTKNNGTVNNRYMLLSCFSDDYFKVNYLYNYYKDNYGVEIIPYDLAELGYEKLEEVLNHLVKMKSLEANSSDEDSHLSLLKGVNLIDKI